MSKAVRPFKSDMDIVATERYGRAGDCIHHRRTLSLERTQVLYHVIFRRYLHRIWRLWLIVIKR